MIIAHREIGDLLFGQQHIITQSFFTGRNGQYHTVPLRDFPHYEFLKGHLDHPYSESYYRNYLEVSWDYYFPDDNTDIRRWKKIDNFIKLHQNISQNGQQKPVTFCVRPDGKRVIIDGNHRASAAYDLGLDLKAEEIPLQQRISEIIHIPGIFYGTQHRGVPYQSIIWGGKEYVTGRRRDIYDRIDQIDPEDLKGKSVLDLGCNLGMSCYSALENGAVSAMGVEFEPQIASAACRLNSIFAANACFAAYDLNQPFDSSQQVDTVFCFSLVEHLRDKRALVKTIMNHQPRVLYFEGHAGSRQSTYPFILNKDLFHYIARIGSTADGSHTDKHSRPLFRCEL